MLVPLLLVYTAILYAYAIKIGFEGTLPKGTLGTMVVGYLVVGAATLVLAYPTRDSGGALVRLFWQAWVWLALMPVALLFLAIYTRIEAYGLTEDRYLIILIGVWALILAVLRIWRGGNFDLRFVPGVLAILLLAACAGPWGAIGASVLSQKAELASILRAKGLLADGKIVAPSSSSLGGRLRLGTDAPRVRSIVTCLNAHHALDRLAPWFEGQDPDPFAEGNMPLETLREVSAALSLGTPVPSSPQVRGFSDHSSQPGVVSLGGNGSLIGPVMFSVTRPGLSATRAQTVSVEGLGTVRLVVKGDVLTAQVEGGPSSASTLRLWGGISQFRE